MGKGENYSNDFAGQQQTGIERNFKGTNLSEEMKSPTLNTKNSSSQHVQSQKDGKQRAPSSVHITRVDSEGAHNHTLQDDAGLKTIETPKKAGTGELVT